MTQIKPTWDRFYTPSNLIEPAQRIIVNLDKITERAKNVLKNIKEKTWYKPEEAVLMMKSCILAVRLETHAGCGGGTGEEGGGGGGDAEGEGRGGAGRMDER